MKKLITAVAALFLCGTLCAQNYKIARVEAYETADGIVVPDMTTPLAVDLSVECENFVAGPYARYAQKYLGVRATLSDKKVYDVTAAEVAILSGGGYPVAGVLPAATSEALGFGGTDSEFAKILPDRTSTQVLSAEAAAQAAAAEIFRLRRQRIELISGEEGENVFGAGLQSALDELKALEEAYTALFLGKRTVTRRTVRYVVRPSADRTSYIVCRFSPQEGILPANDLSGDVVLLQIRPTGEAAVSGLHEAGEKERYAMFRVADNTECTLSVGTEELTRTVVPLLVFGRNVRVALPAKK